MTEIRIRNGVPKSLPSYWSIYAWDASRNDDNSSYTNAVGAQFSLLDEWKLQNAFFLESTWGLYDSTAVFGQLYQPKTPIGVSPIPQSATYPPNTALGNVTSYPSIVANSWTYRGAFINLVNSNPWYQNDNAWIYNNTVWGAVIQFNIFSLAANIHQFLITVGTRLIGEPYPSWAAVSMNYWYESSNQHDHIECRVGEIIQRVKLNQFDRTKPHLYVIQRSPTHLNFYVDSDLIASIPIPSGTLWTSTNSTNIYDIWWYLSSYGYQYSSGSTVNVFSYAYFRMDMSWYTNSDHSNVVLLCKSRYSIDDSAHSTSTQTITLNQNDFGIFGSSVFSTRFL